MLPIPRGCGKRKPPSEVQPFTGRERVTSRRPSFHFLHSNRKLSAPLRYLSKLYSSYEHFPCLTRYSQCSPSNPPPPLPLPPPHNPPTSQPTSSPAASATTVRWMRRSGIGMWSATKKAGKLRISAVGSCWEGRPGSIRITGVGLASCAVAHGRREWKAC